MLAVIVDVLDLLDAVIASVVSALAVILIFSIAIWGATRFVDLSRDGRMVAASAAITVGAIAFLATLAIAAAGIVVMLRG